MSDDDLIARLRKADEYEPLGHDGWEAADRIEALVKGLSVINEIGRAFEEDAGQQRARAERLEAALVEHNDLLRSALAIAKREGIEGQIASTNWDAYYNRVAVVLKHHHQTANEARAALKGADND